VTLRWAPGRGRNFHGARRPSGMSLSNPVCSRVCKDGAWKVRQCAIPSVQDAGRGLWDLSRRTGYPHGDDRRKAGCLHQNSAAANARTSG
jgi:hypothetical protein